MSTKSKMTPDPYEQLKAILGDAPRDYAFLAEYVGELEHHRHEQDTFTRLAFRDVMPGGAYGGTGLMMVSVFSEMYEPLNSEQKTNIRQWWHEKIRHAAEAFADLKDRLKSI
jgi:hypothetical protein